MAAPDDPVGPYLLSQDALLRVSAMLVHISLCQTKCWPALEAHTKLAGTALVLSQPACQTSFRRPTADQKCNNPRLRWRDSGGPSGADAPGKNQEQGGVADRGRTTSEPFVGWGATPPSSASAWIGSGRGTDGWVASWMEGGQGRRELECEREG